METELREYSEKFSRKLELQRAEIQIKADLSRAQYEFMKAKERLHDKERELLEETIANGGK